jgi:hypothetical protein
VADLSDVVNLLAAMAAAACYPNGPGSPSVTGGSGDVKIYPGWPVPAALDVDLALGRTNVSVFPLHGGSGNVFQVLDEFYVVAPAVHGMTASIAVAAGGASATVTLSGAPGAGEFCTIIADGRHAYSEAGASAAAIVAALASAAAANYPSVSASGNSITFPTTRLVANIGAPATLGKATHRQKDNFALTVWAPTPSLRDTVAAAIDVSLKKTNRVTFPDTSQGVLAFSHPRQIDDRSAASEFRRDLVYSMEYATLDLFPGVQITSVVATLDTGPSEYGSAAVTTFSWG